MYCVYRFCRKSESLWSHMTWKMWLRSHLPLLPRSPPPPPLTPPHPALLLSNGSPSRRGIGSSCGWWAGLRPVWRVGRGWRGGRGRWRGERRTRMSQEMISSSMTLDLNSQVLCVCEREGGRGREGGREEGRGREGGRGRGRGSSVCDGVILIPQSPVLPERSCLPVILRPPPPHPSLPPLLPSPPHKGTPSPLLVATPPAPPLASRNPGNCTRGEIGRQGRGGQERPAVSMTTPPEVTRKPRWVRRSRAGRGGRGLPEQRGRREAVPVLPRSW